MAMRWYSVSVFSNFEKKVAEAIREAVEQALRPRGSLDRVEQDEFADTGIYY